jgi:PIN domain nuclease of toxin-antitoxin system
VTLLLDTHVVLWWRLDSPRLKRAARRAIATADLVWVSAASGWEAAIKQGLGKLDLAGSFAEMVAASDFRELPVTLRHAERVAVLPTHHTDPFDRMLAAQAQLERATLVTHDRLFEPYDLPILWV